jgi:hypothetical protein
MNESTKIEEAKHFLKRMREESQSPTENFRYELSAFLSAARTVFQYAFNEAKAKPGGEVWYSAQIAANRYFQFFRDERNENIHKVPVIPQQNTSITPGTHQLTITGSRPIVERSDENKTPETLGPTNESRLETQPLSSGTTSYNYKFISWTGPEDVISLAQKYLDDLDQFVIAARRDQWIS